MTPQEFLLTQFNTIEKLDNYTVIKETGILEESDSLHFPSMLRENATVKYFLISSRNTRIAIEEREFLKLKDNNTWSSDGEVYLDKPCYSYIDSWFVAVVTLDYNDGTELVHRVSDVARVSEDFSLTEYLSTLIPVCS